MERNQMEEYRDSFLKEAMSPEHPKWEKATSRQSPLEKRGDEIRSEFDRDYTRILHSMGYRRLKHKTQVFFAPENDHICTRIEHVNHVESASFTIAKFLGLNTELTKAISIGHDIGHAPFGHLGEELIREITERELGVSFWHEKNGLHFVDEVEYLYDSSQNYTNLNLTYAVRDGIISHCGEVNDHELFPRKEAIDLSQYETVGQYSPFTWEGCVVKCADKISYIGRDIEDAVRLKILSACDTQPLIDHANEVFGIHIRVLNTTSLMHLFIIDLCKNSSPGKGMSFSEPVFQLMKAVLSFNIEKIYRHPRLDTYKKFASAVIHTIYGTLLQGYRGPDTLDRLERLKASYPDVVPEFIDWIKLRSDLGGERRGGMRICYRTCLGEAEYKRAVIDYIAGMTDNYAKRIFDNIFSYK